MRRRLALLAAATTSMVVLAFCVPLALVVRADAEDRAVHAGELEARSLAAVLAGSRDPAVIGPIIEQANAGSPRPATVFLPDGTVLGDHTLSGAELDGARSGRAFTASVPGGRAVLVPVEGSGGPAVVRVLISQAQLERGVQRAWVLLAIVAIGLTLLALVLADQMGRALVRPVESLRKVTERLREGDRSARASGDGPREIAEVGREVNRLADRIEALMQAEREATADLSHRLRTPLTALRLDVEALPVGADRERLAHEVDALESAIDQLIRSARGEQDRRAQGPIDLAAAARARLAFWSVVASQQARAVDVVIADSPCVVDVTAEDLDAAIDALVGNVLAHTPEGSRFRVEVTPVGSSVALVVEDSGSGFGTDSLVDRGRSGAGSTGLGLDIVRRTAEASGGHLAVTRSPLGGARVEAVFGASRG